MKRSRRLLPRLLASAGLTVALVAVVTTFSGIGYAESTAGQAEYAPSNTAPPSISGNAAPSSVLTASNGTWTSSTQPTFAYQWQRCNTTGGSCADLAGATAQTYTVQQGDIGSTLRVRVTATNPTASTAAQSQPTAVVATATPSGKTVAAADVTLPNRLIVNRARYSPSRLSSRAPFTARFHIADSNGRAVQGALVYALGLPYSWARNAAEVPTDANGWATITLRPTSNLPLHRGAALVIFVRARVQGQSLLSGASTRRLVQITVR